jgi:hypothetical protein
MRLLSWANLLAVLVFAGTYKGICSLTIAPFAVSAPLDQRQIGDLQCNIARIKTVGALGKAKKAVKALAGTAK